MLWSLFAFSLLWFTYAYERQDNYVDKLLLQTVERQDKYVDKLLLQTVERQDKYVDKLLLQTVIQYCWFKILYLPIMVSYGLLLELLENYS